LQLNKKNNFSKGKKKILFLFLFVVIFLWLTLNGSLTPLMANGADYVLRPIVGETNTIRIESIVFTVVDRVHQILPATLPTLLNNSASSSSLQTNLNLHTIPAQTHLPLLQNEGVWQPIFLAQFPKQEVMAQTIIRVDDQRPYAYVTLVKIDMNKVNIGTVAGIRQPGGPIGNPGDGKVPNAIKLDGKLLAAFDGGFQYRDGAYGMVVGQKVYVPLRPNLATLFIDVSGKPTIRAYDGQTIPAQTAAIRQNGVLLVENGQITSFTESGADNWGRTITNSIYTWRSGIGITTDGSLLFAVGPSLEPSTLALALKAAGAINAMQLDVNPYWVRFVIFHPIGDGTYQSTSLLKEMQNGGYSYLYGYQKDFFYLYAK